jgi:hypothetical protein
MIANRTKLQLRLSPCRHLSNPNRTDTKTERALFPGHRSRAVMINQYIRKAGMDKIATQPLGARNDEHMQGLDCLTLLPGGVLTLTPFPLA